MNAEGRNQNQCPHQLDLLQWLCGLPVKVRAFCHEAKWHNIEVEDDVTAYMEFENGATGVFVTTTADAPGTNRLELTFEMGKIICEYGKLKYYKLSENERVHCMTEKEGFKAPEVTEIDVETDGQNEQHIGVLKAFTNHILHGEDLVASGFNGYLSLEPHLSDFVGFASLEGTGKKTLLTEGKKMSGFESFELAYNALRDVLALS